MIRTPLARNVMGHIRGLLCETEEDQSSSSSSSSMTTSHRSRSTRPAIIKEEVCGCGEQRDEDMIECMSGKICGGWVHFSCAGIDFEHFNADEKDQFICKWCRAAGVNVGDPKEHASHPSKKAKSPSFDGKEEEEEEQRRVETRHERSGRVRSRAKKEGRRNDNEMMMGR